MVPKFFHTEEDDRAKVLFNVVGAMRDLSACIEEHNKDVSEFSPDSRILQEDVEEILSEIGVISGDIETDAESEKALGGLIAELGVDPEYFDRKVGEVNPQQGYLKGLFHAHNYNACYYLIDRLCSSEEDKEEILRNNILRSDQAENVNMHHYATVFLDHNSVKRGLDL